MVHGARSMKNGETEDRPSSDDCPASESTILGLMRAVNQTRGAIFTRPRQERASVRVSPCYDTCVSHSSLHCSPDTSHTAVTRRDWCGHNRRCIFSYFFHVFLFVLSSSIGANAGFFFVDSCPSVACKASSGMYHEMSEEINIPIRVGVLLYFDRAGWQREGRMWEGGS